MDWTPGAAPELTVWRAAEVRDEDEGEQVVEEEVCDDWPEVEGRSWGPGGAAVVDPSEGDRVAGGLEQGGERQERSSTPPPPLPLNRGGEEVEGVGGGGEETELRAAEVAAEVREVGVMLEELAGGEDKGAGAAKNAAEPSGLACEMAPWAWAKAWGWICAWAWGCG